MNLLIQTEQADSICALSIAVFRKDCGGSKSSKCVSRQRLQLVQHLKGASVDHSETTGSLQGFSGSELADLMAFAGVLNHPVRSI